MNDENQAENVWSLLLTLNVPSPPDGIVEANLVPPEKFQALEVFPFWGHQSSTEEENNNKQHSVTLTWTSLHCYFGSMISCNSIC